MGFICLGASAAYAEVDMNITSFGDSPDPVAASFDFTYDLTVENSGADPAPDAALAVTVPAGITFKSVTPAACGYNAGAGQVECAFGTLAGTASGGSPVNVQIVMQATLPGVQSIASTATVSTSAADSNAANDSQTQNTSILQGADLALTSNLSPDPVSAGGNVSFALQVENIGPNEADGVRVVEELAPGIEYQSGTGGGWSCSASGQTVTCNHSGNAPVGQLPLLAIVGKVVSSTLGTLTSTATVSSPNTPDGQPGNDTVTQPLTVQAGTDLAVSKQVSPSPVIAGQAVTFTLQVDNLGPMDAANLVLTDTLSAGFSGISASGAGWTCGVTGQTVTCTRPSLTVGSAPPFTVTIPSPRPATYNIALTVGSAPPVTVTATAPATPGSVTNTATVTSDTADAASGNDSGSVTFDVEADGADLHISSAHRYPNPVAIGGTIVTRVWVNDDGPRPATGPIRITAELEAGEEWTNTFSGTGWSCSYDAGTRIATCDYANGLAVNEETAHLELRTQANAAGSYRGHFCTSADAGLEPPEGDPDATNNCVNGNSITVSATTADLALTKTVDKASLPTGDSTLTYTLRITNNGPDDASNVNLSDALPMYLGGTAYRPATGVTATVTQGAGTCTTGSTVNCSFPSIANGATAEVQVQVSRPMRDGNHTNTASAYSADIGDSNRSNNRASASATVAAVTDVELTGYTVTPNPVKAGVEAVYVLNFRNNGPSTAAGVQVSNVFDVTSAGTYTYIGATPSKGSCSYDAATHALQCSIGNMARDETQSVTLRIRPDYMVAPPNPRVLRGSASIATSTTESDATNNDASLDLNIDAALVDLLVNQSDLQDPVPFDPGNPGSNVLTYRVKIDNLGPSLATGVQFSDQVTPPAGKQLEFLCDKGAAGDSCDAATPGQICAGQGTTINGPASSTFHCTIGELAAGASTVRYLDFRVVTTPDSTGDTVHNDISVTANEPEADNGNNVASEQTTVRLRPSGISGQVYLDANGNGTFDAGERLLSGVTLTLTGTDFFGDAVNLTVTTDPAGHYSFDDIVASDATGYTLTETQPAGWAEGGAVAGTLGGSVDGASVVSGIVLPVGGIGSGYDFHETGGSLAGFVYSDLDGDGVKDSGETGIAGVTITLTGKEFDGAVVNATATTAADGGYAFTGLAVPDAQGYTLTETQPTDMGDGPDSAGSLGGTVANDVISGIPFSAPGAAGTGYNFGEAGGSLSGYVYSDLDGDGIRDPGERGISGVTVTLTGTDINGTAVNRSTTTGSDGGYRFDAVGASDAAGYTLTETQPAGAADGIDSVGNLGGTAGDDVISGIVFPNAATVGTDYNFGEANAPGLALVRGVVWFDKDHDRSDNDGTRQPGWVVEIVRNGTVVGTATTRDDGSYSLEVEPNAPATDYAIRFRHPETNEIYHLETGLTFNPGINEGDRFNFPLDPYGLIYDSITRLPVAGATVTLGGVDASQVVGGTLTQTTAADGFYQFLLSPTVPDGTYHLTLTVTPPGSYLQGPSVAIPPCANTLSVGPTPDPAVVHASASAPPQGASVHDPAACPTTSAGLAAGAATTQYFLAFTLTKAGGVQSADVVNNHIPVDPLNASLLTITKTTPKVNVSRGELVPYTITVTNGLASPLNGVVVEDQIPPGFKYVAGSARVDGVANEPAVDGRSLRWAGLDFAADTARSIRLALVPGAGVGDGDYTNQAWVSDGATQTRLSPIATARVRVTPDPTFDCSDVVGKVFDDRNANGYQDQGEPGIANVRLATVRGLLVTTDAHGRFHVTCAATPDRDRGANFIMKLDPRSLPSGYRLTTENPRVVRLTRGKLAKLNFGASAHRVVRVDANHDLFGTDGRLKPVWNAQIDELMRILKKRPSVLRLVYTRMVGETKSEARARLNTLRSIIKKRWEDQKACCYDLTLETELRLDASEGGAK